LKENFLKLKTKNNKSKTFFLILVVFLFFDISTAYTYEKIVGDAVVVLAQKKKSLTVRQAIHIDRNASRFVSLDDFGNTVLTLSFIKDSRGKELLQFGGEGGRTLSGSKTKKLLKLDLNQGELSSLLLAQKPDGWECNAAGKLKKGKKLEAEFSDFTRVGHREYPRNIRISSGKNSLTVKWQKIDLLR